jgi:uncharacterized linocin/CFP29 family protein
VTVTDHLLRDLAPIPPAGWKVIDDEARERLTPLLAARRLADWVGPGGWRHDAVALGRTTEVSSLPAGVNAAGAQALQRRVLPLTEFRVPFAVARAEIADIQRGASNPALDDLDRAARAAAAIENRAICHGWDAAGITGIAQASPYPAAEFGADCSRYPAIVAVAVDLLRRAGIDGPYALAISPEHYTRIVETTENGGYLLVDHLSRILDGKVIWSPGVDSAIVLSQRGGDFLLDVGQDLSIGYSHHDADNVHLYLEESFTFRVVEPDAARALS